MQDIKEFFISYNRQRSFYDTVSPLQALFEFYSHRSPPETRELQALRARVEALTGHLPYAEQERYAVMEGICLGARTLLALTEANENND